MNTAHTTGPWYVTEATVLFEQIVCSGYGNQKVEIAYAIAKNPSSSWNQNYPSKYVMHANASLIAAAPELLAALRKLMDAWPEGMACEHNASAAFDDAYAAIAKATGDDHV